MIYLAQLIYDLILKCEFLDFLILFIVTKCEESFLDFLFK